MKRFPVTFVTYALQHSYRRIDSVTVTSVLPSATIISPLGTLRDFTGPFMWHYTGQRERNMRSTEESHRSNLHQCDNRRDRSEEDQPSPCDFKPKGSKWLQAAQDSCHWLEGTWQGIPLFLWTRDSFLKTPTSP